MKKINFDQAALLLKVGKIGVLPTDTIYGIHASAFDKQAIEKIYKIRERDKNKPLIILISDVSDIEKFDIKISQKEKEVLANLWPNPVSIVLKQKAFRVPKHDKLLELLNKTGPLVSTSVNKQGEKPAETTKEAFSIFGDKIDFYIDEGKLTSEPSTLLAFENGEVKILREGKYKYENH